MRFALAVLIIIALTGCVTMEQRKAKFASMINTYVGQNSDFLVIAEGVPSNAIALSSGERVFEYSKNQMIKSGGGSDTVMESIHADGPNGGAFKWRWNIPARQSDSVPIPEPSCKLLFRISATNIVENWSSEGNSCY